MYAVLGRLGVLVLARIGQGMTCQENLSIRYRCHEGRISNIAYLKTG